MNVGSLFTGVGGFDLGFERAGHTIKWQCEVEESKRQVLAKHWPNIPIYGDVEQFPLSDAEQVEVVCAGFPCQDISVAGKGAGLAGSRSRLFWAGLEAANAVLGDGGWLILENVGNLLGSKGGRDFTIILAALQERGFLDGAWRVLNSQYFGVAQRRRRVFLLARRARGRCASQVLLEPESGSRDLEESAQAAQKDPRGAAERAAASVWRSDRDYSPTLQTTAGDYSMADGFTVLYRDQSLGRESEGRDARNGNHPSSHKGWRQDGAGLPSDQRGPSGAPPHSNRVREAAGISRRLDSDLMEFRTTAGSLGADAHRNASPTLTKTGPAAVSGDLEAFGSDRCAIDPRPDGRRYAAMGDAVTVNVAEWIGRRLMEFGNE